MTITVGQLRWLLKEYEQEGDGEEIDHLREQYERELELDDTILVGLTVRDHDTYLRRIETCPIVVPDRSQFGPLPPKGWLSQNLPKPAPVSALGTKMSGNWPEHTPTDNPIPPERELSIPPGPNFDLLAARGIQRRFPNVSLEAYSFITASYRQEQEQRAKARQEEEAMKKQQYGGAFELSNQWEAEVLDEWMDELTDDSVIQCSVSYQDLRRIYGNARALYPAWLNDTIVETFMQFVVNWMAENERKAWAIPTAFADLVRRGQWQTLDELAAERNYVEVTYDIFDALILPWNTGDHWYLLVAESRTKRILLWNSLHSDYSDASARHLRDFVERVSGKEWSIAYQSSPQQNDTNLCGVLTCYNAARYAFTGKVSLVKRVTQREAENMRYWLLLIFKTGKLTEELLKRMK